LTRSTFILPENCRKISLRRIWREVELIAMFEHAWQTRLADRDGGNMRTSKRGHYDALNMVVAMAAISTSYTYATVEPDVKWNTQYALMAFMSVRRAAPTSAVAIVDQATDGANVYS
jgi:hypothetical protein